MIEFFSEEYNIIYINKKHIDFIIQLKKKKKMTDSKFV